MQFRTSGRLCTYYETSKECVVECVRDLKDVCRKSETSHEWFKISLGLNPVARPSFARARVHSTEYDWTICDWSILVARDLLVTDLHVTAFRYIRYHLNIRSISTCLLLVQSVTITSSTTTWRRQRLFTKVAMDDSKRIIRFHYLSLNSCR